MQARNRDANIENRLAGHSGGRRRGDDLESNTDIYTLPCIKQIASGKLLYGTESSAWRSVITQMGAMGEEGGGKESQEGRDVCIHIANSLLYNRN